MNRIYGDRQVAERSRSSGGNLLKELPFHYIKSPWHQEIKVDGAIGGPGPGGGSITVSVYTERQPIPTLAVHEMTDLGEGRSQIGPEIKDRRESRDGLVRVVQATLHMTLAQAKVVHTWLGGHIEALERARGER